MSSQQKSPGCGKKPSPCCTRQEMIFALFYTDSSTRVCSRSSCLRWMAKRGLQSCPLWGFCAVENIHRNNETFASVPTAPSNPGEPPESFPKNLGSPWSPQFYSSVLASPRHFPPTLVLSTISSEFQDQVLIAARCL